MSAKEERYFIELSIWNINRLNFYNSIINFIDVLIEIDRIQSISKHMHVIYSVKIVLSRKKKQYQNKK